MGYVPQIWYYAIRNMTLVWEIDVAGIGDERCATVVPGSWKRGVSISILERHRNRSVIEPRVVKAFVECEASL
jgi:hypothetical protein